MSFAEIIKKRNTDLWLVLQGLPLPDDGGSTIGDIIYQGAGSVDLARLIRECYQTYLTVTPPNQGGLYPAPAALGYKTYQGMCRYTHTLDVWEAEDGAIYGNLRAGVGYALAHVDLADSAQQMSAPGWDEQTWERLQASFQYAEQPPA